jgi:phosphatidylserine/phosphatidylglycerophosphate/cardiolipin synthase-like enzyme
MALDAARYFPTAPSCPTFTEDTQWQPLIDGRAYFAELDDLFARATGGDTVLITGFEVDPAIDLRGRRPGDAGYTPLGEQLAGLAARGVDVRICVAGQLVAASIPWSGLGPFRANAEHAWQLRTLRVDGGPPPLARRVLVDHAVPLLGSNHRKTVSTHIDGQLTCYVGGIDLAASRNDAAPHDRHRLRGERWGWHDVAVRLRGCAARAVWDAFADRWCEALAEPSRRYFHLPWQLRRLNPADLLRAPGPAPDASPVSSPGVSVRILRSTYRREHEVYETLISAFAAARRYIYIEDQYLGEAAGGDPDFELFPHLRSAAQRGVKVILVGSGTRDPGDPGVRHKPINRALNADIRRKLIGPLPDQLRTNVVVHRVEHCTVHAKLTLVDDAFANIGSANMFSRSMTGMDCEISAAVATSTGIVRDLRVALWGEHLRAAMTDRLRVALADLDLALGIWRSAWLPAGAAASTWRTAGAPDGFEPSERVLIPVE